MIDLAPNKISPGTGKVDVEKTTPIIQMLFSPLDSKPILDSTGLNAEGVHLRGAELSRNYCVACRGDVM